MLDKMGFVVYALHIGGGRRVKQGKRVPQEKRNDTSAACGAG